MGMDLWQLFSSEGEEIVDKSLILTVDFLRVSESEMIGTSIEKAEVTTFLDHW